MKKKNPCFKCRRRKPACHSSCEHYMEWKLECDRVRIEVNKKKDAIKALDNLEVIRAGRRRK